MAPDGVALRDFCVKRMPALRSARAASVETMKMRSRYRLLGGTAFLMLLGSVTYSCSDFLDVLPQGTVD